jgi:hypothetical protein
VLLQATGSDSAAGNHNVTAAEYFIDIDPGVGSATAFTIATPAPVVSLNATIPAATVNALAEGSHLVTVRAQDALGNWGAVGTVALVVDKTGPATSGVFATPSATNGANGVQVGTGGGYYQRIDASVSDAGGQNSNVVAAEYFIDSVGANGTGGVMLAADGSFNSSFEAVYAAIDLYVINQLGIGNHTICVHGKDVAGNWGSCTNITLLVDKTAPTFTSISLAPNPTAGAANVTLTVNGANDPLVGGLASGVAGGEYWINPPTTTNPAPGSGTAFTGLTASIPVGSLLPGTYTVSARIRDTAGNWSTGTGGVRSATLTVSQPPIYFSTAGASNPPGVGGTADDADIYFYNGAAFSRSIDASAAPYSLPGAANVDGFDRVDATHFYMSFNGTVTLPGAGTVQDEDVVFYNAGTWSVFFDGTPAARGLSGSDLDAISVVGGVLYFSTDNTSVPAGVSGGGDDADIYSWNGTSFARVFDASALGWSTANVDGFVRVDATHFYVSYSADTTVPGLGAVQDEDVVYYNAGVWSVYFNGTVLGLTSANLDIDAFDLP